MKLSALLTFLTIASAALIPAPTGPYSVALQVQALEDTNRVDPYSPSNNRHPRQVMASIFWPVTNSTPCNNTIVPYMPSRTAQLYGFQASSMGLSNDTFSSLGLRVCQVEPIVGCRAVEKPQWPLVIFSPGAGNSRLLYSGQARFLASHGYVVVTVDHPYDAPIVEFPDETVIRSASISEEAGPLEQLNKIRAEDISFLISRLKDPMALETLKAFPGTIDFNRVFAMGHSLGGASAAVAVLSDPRIRGGIMSDGRIIEPALSNGLDKPFLQLGRPNHREEDPTWDLFWEKLRGPAVEASIAGSVHGSFTDFPLIVDALDLPESIRPALDALVGTIDVEKMPDVLAETISAFILSALEGSSMPFIRATQTISELSIVREKFYGST